MAWVMRSAIDVKGIEYTPFFKSRKHWQYQMKWETWRAFGHFLMRKVDFCAAHLQKNLWRLRLATRMRCREYRSAIRSNSLHDPIEKRQFSVLSLMYVSASTNTYQSASPSYFLASRKALLCSSIRYSISLNIFVLRTEMLWPPKLFSRRRCRG